MPNTTIQLKKSATPSATPTSLANGELAINFADGKLFYKNTSGYIAEISGTSPGALNAFGTVNANGTLVVADTSADVFSLLAGNNITIVGDAINDTITIGLKNDVTITGELFINNGVGAGGSDEGGEIKLANATQNQILSGPISVDIYQNKLRFFETNSPNRGAFINLAACGTTVGTDLLATSSSVDNVARDIATSAFNKANNALANSSGAVFNGDLIVSQNITADKVLSNNNGNGENFKVGDDAWIGDVNLANTIRIKGQQNSSIGYVIFGPYDGKALGRNGDGPLTYDNNTIWHSGNDGAGSGLDADLLDGQNSTYFATATELATAYGRANSAFDQGTAAYGRANTAYDHANNAYGRANTAYDQATAAYGRANTAYDQGTAAYGSSNSAYIHANNAYGRANSALDQATTAYGRANTAYDQATAAYGRANTAYDHANNAYGRANSAFDQATAAYGRANTAYDHANTAYGRANTAYDQATAAYGRANTAYDHANSAYSRANTAFDQSTAAYGRANSAFDQGTAAYGRANTAYDHANAAYSRANSSFDQATAAYGRANTAYDHANNAYGRANSALDQATTAYGRANTAYDQATAAYGRANTAYDQATAAYNHANTKYSSSGGTITGDVSIVGNLTISGNTGFINVQNYRVEDSLIYLAANNYANDIVDIGFVANYVNANGYNVHTGLYREHSNKEYYLFQGYDQEPINNHIGAMSNNMTLAVLNADIKTNNIILAGINAVSWITTAYTRANSAFDQATAAYGRANSAFDQGTAAYGRANAAFDQGTAAYGRANTAYDHANAAYGRANTAFDSVSGAFNQANTAYNQANAAYGRANTVGTVTNDTASATRYIVFTNSTSGLLAPNVDVGLTFVPSSNTLTINGPLNAITKSFVIKHPTKDGSFLRYGSLEGPENGVYVRGKLEGKSIIELPDYWWNLIDDRTITVNLTPYGRSQDLWVQSTSAHFIHLNQPADCFYTVFAERKDVDKLVVEY